MKKIILAVLAYVLPTFPLGYFWHLKAFADYYESLHVYREDVIIPFGLLSMLVQGIVWAVIYRRMFAGQPIVGGAIKFAGLALPLAWSFMALAVSAKHQMTSPYAYLGIETAFVMLHYLIVSPLVAAVYRHGP
jgi:riboflavin transporter FmnP